MDRRDVLRADSINSFILQARSQDFRSVGFRHMNLVSRKGQVR